jgi:hypothetical protein
MPILKTVWPNSALVSDACASALKRASYSAPQRGR